MSVNMYVNMSVNISEIYVLKEASHTKNEEIKKMDDNVSKHFAEN